MRYILTLASLILGLTSQMAFATISLNLSGSNSTTTANLEKTKSRALSANIGLSLGSFLSIGVTQRRTYEDLGGYKKGYMADGKTPLYLPFRQLTEQTINSVDLTLIPYQGVVSPFIFGGVAKRDYFTQLDYQGMRLTSKQILYPVPNYGGGLAIQLGSSFQLKVTQTYTPGKQTDLTPEGEEKTRDVRDFYTELWLGYKI